MTSHEIKDCYFLFPERAPKSWTLKELDNCQR